MKKKITYIIDDLEIYSDDSDEKQMKTKYPIRFFLAKMCKAVKIEVFIKVFLV